jgi:hypothetical protein
MKVLIVAGDRDMVADVLQKLHEAFIRSTKAVDLLSKLIPAERSM